MRAKRSKVVVLVLALAMVAAACGSRLSEEERALVLASGASTAAPVDEVEGVGSTEAVAFEVAIEGDPTGGHYVLAATVDDDAQETDDIAHDADADGLAEAIGALSNVGASNVEVTGSGPFTVLFVNELAGSDAALEVAADELSGGTDPGVTVTEVEPPDTTGPEVAGPTDGGTTGGTTGGDTTGGDTGGTDGPAGPGACTPGSATGPGVTPTTITVGNVSQLSGLVPGFGQTGVNAVRAYFNMVNNQGGVCGRQLKLATADDRFQAAVNRSETEKLADQVLAFVGSVTVVDEGGAPVIEAKGVADVSLSTSTPRIRAANNFSPNPINPDPSAGSGLVPVLRHMKETHGVTTPAILYLDAATGVNQANSFRTDFENAGIPVASQNMYKMPPTGGDYRVPASQMKDSGVDFVITVAEVNAMAKLAQAFGAVNYKPKVPFYGAQVYGQKFLQIAGPHANGTEVGLIFAIPEEKATNPAIAAFATWYGRTNPGADVDFFALLSWVAADMFVTALRNVGPDPTQANLIAELKTFTSYTGNGLVPPINPAEKKSTTCFHVVTVENGQWTKKFPDQGFKC